MGYLITKSSPLKSFTITIPNADVLQLNSAPYLIIPAKIKTAFVPVTCYITTEGTLSYFSFTKISVRDFFGSSYFAGAVQGINPILSPMKVATLLCNWENGTDSAGGVLPTNRDIYLQTDVDPTNGDGDIRVTLYGYEISL